MVNARQKVITVVVTYNRKKLLAECLDALLAQTVRQESILIINNASTDGTEKLFEPGGRFETTKIPVELITLSENTGGAGGFSEGIRLAYGLCDWVWIMDDDTIPERDALEGLLDSEHFINKSGVTPSFLASTVFGPEREPMNVPVISKEPATNGYSDWYRFLSAGCVRIREATFVSLLIKSDAIRKVGYPDTTYFIWGDDTEYTRKLVRDYGPAFFCGKSCVMHKRYNAKKISIFKETDRKRIQLYHYYFRNALRNSAKFDGAFRTAVRLIGYFAMSFSAFFRDGQRHRFLKFITIQKGCFEFIFDRK